MASVESSVVSPTFRRQVERIGIQRGRLKTLGHLIGLQAIQRHQRLQAANQEAENRFVRRTAWGDDSTVTVDSEHDDMGTTILGDVTNPTPVVIQSPPSTAGSGIGRLLVGLAIGALVPIAGLAGYLLPAMLGQSAPAVTTSTPTPTPRPTPGETIEVDLDLGLQHVEDLDMGRSDE